MIRLIIIGFILLGQTSVFSQFHDHCHHLVQTFQDDSLKSYLDKEQQNVEGNDLISFHLFSSLYHRFNGIEGKEQLSHIYDGLSLCVSTNQDSFKAMFLDELAIASRHQGLRKVENRFSLINESIQIKQRMEDVEGLAKSYLIKGNLFYDDQSLDSALHYYDKTTSISRNETLKRLAAKNTTSIYLDRQNWENIESSCLSHYTREKELRQYEDAAKSMAKLVSFYVQSQQFDKAEKILDTLIDHALGHDFYGTSHTLIANRAALSDSLKDFEAASMWKDSLTGFSHQLYAKETRDAAEKYKGALYQSQLAEAETKRINNRLWMIIFGGLLALALLIGFGGIQYQRFKKRSLVNELERTKIQSAFDATRAKMEGEQKERQQIASVLHDEIASLLAAASLHLGVAKKQTKNPVFLNKTSDIIEDVSIHVRDLSHQLVSPALLKFGLEMAIDSFVEKNRNPNRTIDFESNLSGMRLHQATENFIYRSSMELMNNINKHSNANQVHISLLKKEQQIKLEVKDNGTHIKTSPSQSFGLGLTHIQSRAEALGGTFTFTKSNQGSIAILSIPIE